MSASLLQESRPLTGHRGTADTDRFPPAAAAVPGHVSSIRRDISDDGVCVLTFDKPDSSANVFDRATLIELREHLDFVAHNHDLRGLVLASAKNAVFVAGADLHSLTQSAENGTLLEIVELGQSTFNRLASLAIPTVAAIHGAALGGGLEVCLACDYRVASTDRATRLGLPETQLGIIPAWGGSTRLPRLIGLPNALDIILAGKTLAPKPSLKCGLVDDLAPRERLLDAARRLVQRGKPRRKSHWLVNNPIARRIIASRALVAVMGRTRGNYPAVLRALEVVTRGVARPLAEALRLEADAILELASTEACRNLVRVFFLQERAKKLKVASVAETPIKRAAVIGAGVMGAGIAQWLSARGLPVVLRDINAEQVARGMATVEKLYRDAVKRHLFTPVEARQGLDRVFPAPDEVPLGQTDLIIEAAVEKLELKKQLFRRLDESARPEAILATNTSALPVSDIAAATRHPERVVGIHFFNPVHRMQLVEVVVGRQTSPATTQRAVRLVQQIGKLPVVVADRPGFLVNRVLMPYLLEAGRLFEAGARIRDLDEAMLEFGMPMGPMRLLDEVGIDVSLHVATTLAAAFADRMHLPPLLKQMIDSGLLGRKSGRGFYVHHRDSGEINDGVNLFQTGDSARGLAPEELQQRMVLLMANEAARCLEEAVVRAPEDVDFGMIMGTGFAPFRGGPLRYADSLGAAKVVELMTRLVEAGQPHFKPCALLSAKAEAGETFYPGKGRTT
jgi:3-hydroxyacyl-CoA dehydrogenase/enoyl-CoA hydratase/3-hydroxybutyryl-CoA epimerase